MNILNESLEPECKHAIEKLKLIFQNEKPSHYAEDSGEPKDDDGLSTYCTLLLSHIENSLNRVESNSIDYIKLLTMKASLYYEQAKVKLIDKYSEDSLEKLQTTLALIDEYSDHNYIIFLYLKIINHLTYLLSKNGNLEEAKQLLEKIINTEYKDEIMIYSTEDLFSVEEPPKCEDASLKFNKLMINNMQMLGWIYGRLGLYDLHTKIEHKSLQKYLDCGEYNPLQWTSKCSRLSTLFLSKCNWLYARYYLAMLGAVLDKWGDDKEPPTGSFAKAKVELARAWINYGLHLYSASKRKMLEHMYDNEAEQLPEPENSSTDTTETIHEDYKFNNFETSIPEIPASFITTTQEARVLFMHTHAWLKQLRMFYTLKEHPLQYVNAVLDLSELYRFLAFYESDLESQYNVQKRRSESLEALSTLLREVRPNCYIAVNVELWRELAEVQIEMMGINLKRLYTYENDCETEDSLKRRMSAVEEVHNKLETIGDVIAPTSNDTKQESDNNNDTVPQES